MREGLQGSDSREGERGAPTAARVARRRWLAWWVGGIVAALVLGFAMAQLARTGGSAEGVRKAFGFRIGDFRAAAQRESRLAPALEGEALGGGRLALADYRGKVVILNLWGSWCGPCRKEQPDLLRVERAYRDRGVQFIGLNIRDSQANARAFRDEFGVDYPSFFDPSAALTFRLGVQVLPTTFVINREGRIVFRFTGTVDEPLLRSALDALLESRAPGDSP